MAKNTAVTNYDRVIKNAAGTRFTVYYAHDDHVKISDGSMCIIVHKPGRLKVWDGKAYGNGAIQVSSNRKMCFEYEEMLAVQALIESAIDMLNAEGHHPIDRSKPAGAEKVEFREREGAAVKPMKPIKKADLVVGGVYLDQNGDKVIYLGEGILTRSDRPQHVENRIGGKGRSPYIFLEIGDRDYKAVPGNEIEYSGDWFPVPDTWAAPKKLYEHVGDVGIDPSQPVSVRWAGDSVFYTATAKGGGANMDIDH